MPFFILICLVATKSVLLSFFTHIQTICPKIRARSLSKKAKSPHPVDERRSKTALLKLSNPFIYTIKCDATEIIMFLGDHYFKLLNSSNIGEVMDLRPNS